jgi:hypothetical protein
MMFYFYENSLGFDCFQKIITTYTWMGYFDYIRMVQVKNNEKSGSNPAFLELWRLVVL